MPEVVGKTIVEMRIYADPPHDYAVGLRFSDGTELIVGSETDTRISLTNRTDDTVTNESVLFE